MQHAPRHIRTGTSSANITTACRFRDKNTRVSSSLRTPAQCLTPKATAVHDNRHELSCHYSHDSSTVHGLNAVDTNVHTPATTQSVFKPEDALSTSCPTDGRLASAIADALSIRAVVSHARNLNIFTVE